MALSNENNKIAYTPSTSTTEFNFPYPYFDSTDIVVTVEDSAGTITVLTPVTGYTVTATNGDPASGATVDTTLTGSYTSGDTVTISREVPYTQEYDLQDGATIDPTALNKALDRTVAQSQQIVDQLDRNISHPITDPDGLDYEVPSVTARASKVAGWDTNGNVIAVDVGSGGGLIGVDTSKGLGVTGGIVEGKVDGTTLNFSSGDFAVKDGGIDTTQLATGAVETAKIEDANVTTAKIADSNVTLGKIDFFVDEDTMVSDSAVKVPSQQSVKAYVDTEVAAGGVVQIVNVQDGAKQYFTGATPIPTDDTIPQSNEGSEVMTLVVTPTSASNNLKVDVCVHSTNSSNFPVTALFKDSDTDALACNASQSSSQQMETRFFTHFMLAGTTNAITFKVRVGGSSTTTTFNGDNNDTGFYGGTLASSITITELKA